jgi:hypothetical protein
MAGSTSLFWKKFCSETNRSGSCVWRGRDIVRPKIAGDPRVFFETLEAFQDANHPEHSDVVEWLGEDFAPEFFASEEINRRLRRRKH